MNLLDFFPFNDDKRRKLPRNSEILREEVDKIGREYEEKSYGEIVENAEPERVVTLTDGARISFSIDAYHRDKNGTISCGINAEGLPTRFGVKPSYHFPKRPDGSVYYRIDRRRRDRPSIFYPARSTRTDRVFLPRKKP